ncbi:MAG: helix-turn-helix transcriptional regulator [Anaeroplasma bactoclasticum]|nr:helix-turn-helix transcriptional regulator [Anaeroplasma bactoclasticum]MCM1557078.1 helix-turn-helix transcriptional regulator [Anaeroplasma bactoclasticum]
MKLKSARAELDMSQAELAQAVGVTRQTINLIESGEYNPTIKLCVAICRVLRKTLDQIFWVEETTQIKEENQKEGRVAI